MPLSTGTSKEARQENIRKEINSGKDPKQAVAIGYAKQRENIAKRAGDGATLIKAMADGFSNINKALRSDK